MRTILIALLITSLALAGCSSEETDEPESPGTAPATTTTTTTTTTEPPASGNETPTPTPAPNTPPTASLSASIQEGTAPITVNFTLDGADADGDALNWTFDANGDGSFEAEGNTLPASVLHEYSEAGTYNATLTVSDGANATSQTISVEVSATPTAPATTQSFSGEWLVDNVYALGDGAALLEEDAFPEALAGLTYAVMAVDAATYGQAFFAKYGCNAELVDGLAFYDAAGTRLARQTDLDAGEICEIEGTVPAGATSAYFWSFGGGDSVAYTTSL